MKKEEWKFIPGYEGLYMVSNWGRVKSLWFGKERILKPGKALNGYLQVCLHKDGKQRVFGIHRLVWITFGDKERNKETTDIDHIDLNKENNYIENLQLLSARENCSKKTFKKEKTSKFVGVCWNKQKNKWQAAIEINNKSIHLGYFTIEKEAAEAYIKAKDNLNPEK